MTRKAKPTPKALLSERERYFVRTRLRAMGLSSLGQYYETAHWRAFRERFRKSSCARCGKGRRKLELHHLTYERLGRETAFDVETLCDACHRAIHGLPPLRRQRRKKRR